MKIVLSKKGFDTSFGGYPSIIEGKALFSMPIPWDDESYKYSELKTESGKNFYEAVSPFYKKIYEKGKSKRFTADRHCHPDPNLTNYFCADNFLGSFGQEGPAQGHLGLHGVSKGDLFIFFGWFNAVENGLFIKNGGKHVMFGYLQIGEIIHTKGLNEDAKRECENKYPWIKQQPHWNFDGRYKDNNCIYIATEHCSFDSQLRGYGTFEYSPKLDLTRPNAATPREWLVPALAELKVSRPKGSKIGADGTFVLPATFGQEFVIEDKSGKAVEWAEALIKKHVGIYG